MASIADVGSIEHYYGIQVPAGTSVPEGVFIESYYTDKIEALKVLKKIKPARMKKFSTMEQATEFNALQSVIPQPPAPVSAAGGGESLPYSSVRIQELVKLRQAIEKGDVLKIRESVDSNPRYLIASGDTPTMLQERFRYNALHCAALKGQVAAAEVILNYLSDASLFSRLYPGDSADCRRQRMIFLIDLYLNTPDKGCNETPLHFAAKFGHAEMVRLLANEVAMDTTRVNKDGFTAAGVACNRTSNAAKQEILGILDGQCYVPLYRSDDAATMPFIGEPWDPSGSISSATSTCLPYREDKDLLCVTSPLRCAHLHSLPTISLPSAPNQKLTPGVSVKAVVGPMSPKQACEFKRNWSSPRRTPSKKECKPVHGFVDIVRGDPEKGLEQVGRTLASDMDVPWLEYWDFLGCAVDIRQPDGLEKLEKYLLSLETDIDQSADMSSGDYKLSTPTTSDNSTPTTSDNSTPNTSDNSTPGHKGDGDLDTTDNQLASLFSTLSIHSPSSPAYVRPQCNISNQPCTYSNSKAPTISDSNGGHLFSPSPSVALPRRSVLECMVPSIAPYMDIIRTFWPFGRGGLSPMTPSKTPQSFQEVPPTNKPELPHMELSSPQTPKITTPLQKIYKPGKRVFLKGFRPCKVDTDVYKALQTVDVDVLSYPAVHNWLSNVTSFSVQDRCSWQSPLALKHRERLRYLREEATPKLVLD